MVAGSSPAWGADKREKKRKHMRYFFTGDTHFGHTNIIKYAKRPYKNVDEMNETLIALWNGVVGKDDCVYHLGDVAFCPPDKATWIVSRLNGQKHLIFGNHDKGLRHDKAFLDQFVWARDFTEIKIADKDAREGSRKIVLCHYAMRVWNKSHHGSWHLYGHSHGSLPDDPNSLSLDVGVDAWEQAPIPYELIKERMAKKKFVPIDHHGTDRVQRY